MKYYINCSYAEKDEAKKLGARWDPTQKKWYYVNEADKTKFEKWIPKEINKDIPNLINIFNEKFQKGKSKYYINTRYGKKSLIEESINDEGYCTCMIYPFKKEWACDDCGEWYDEFDSLYSSEILSTMTDDEITQAQDKIIEKCRQNKHNCEECENWNGFSGGDINTYINSPGIGGTYANKLTYLGQFSSISECRKCIAK